MPNEAVTIYVTKDAETKGIRVAVLEQLTVSDNARAREPADEDGKATVHFLKAGDWFYLKADAVLDARRRQEWAIASLEKRLAAIRAIDLTKPVEGENARRDEAPMQGCYRSRPGGRLTDWH